MNKQFFVLLQAVFIAGAFLYAAENSSQKFIVKNQPKEKLAALSKNAIKERMGEAVRETMHALLDSADSVVQAQRTGRVPVAITCSLHEKIIVLQRKLSRVAESLIDSHQVYKKNHKKHLEESLVLLRSCSLACKNASTKLQHQGTIQEQKNEKAPEQSKKDTLLLSKNIEKITTVFTSLESKLMLDTCLKIV